MKYECELCKDDGMCKNNINSPLYNEKYSDNYDCCDYVDKDWMKNWMVNLMKKEQEPYESNFVKWSKKWVRN